MPERTCSATRAEVKKPRARITRTSGGTDAMKGNTAGTTKYQRKTCTSKGMLRNTSTQTLPRRDSQGLSGKVRKVPISKPKTKATTKAPSDTVRVQPQADKIQLR